MYRSSGQLWGKSESKKKKKVKQLKSKLKLELQNTVIKQWQEKPLLDKFCDKLNRKQINKVKSQQWRRSSGHKAVTEGSRIAVQDPPPEPTSLQKPRETHNEKKIQVNAKKCGDGGWNSKSYCLWLLNPG